MLIRSNAEMIAEVEKAGIRPNWEDPSSLFSDLPWITQCPREFDFESSHWPEQFQYTGPFHDGEGRLELSFPWDRLTGEPIVYASMGTIQNGNADVFRTIAAAVGKRMILPNLCFPLAVYSGRSRSVLCRKMRSSLIMHHN